MRLPAVLAARLPTLATMLAASAETVLADEGTSEVHQLTIGKVLTGVAAFR